MQLPPDTPRIRRHSAQHDDHCLLTAGGRDWRVVRMRGLGHIELRTLDGLIGAVLSLSHADLDAYCALAASWLAPDLSIDNAETVVGRRLGTPISRLSGRAGHDGFDEFARIARSWGYP